MLLCGNLKGVSADTNNYDEGLIAYWNFDEGTGGMAYDSSGNNNNGTIYGASWTTGVSGNALRFDGIDDYVEVPHSDILNPPDAVTVSLWFNETSSSPAYSCLLYKAGEVPTSSGYRDRIYTLWTMSNKKIHFTSTPEGASSQIFYDSPLNSYILNNFSMLTAVVDTANDYMRIYINGVQVQEGSYLGYDTIRSGNYPLRIGNCFKTSSNQYPFSGVIDEVRIYNRALTPNEIRAFYNSYFEPNGNDSSDALSPEPAVQVPVFTPLGMAILIGLLSLFTVLWIRRNQ